MKMSHRMETKMPQPPPALAATAVAFDIRGVTERPLMLCLIQATRPCRADAPTTTAEAPAAALGRARWKSPRCFGSHASFFTQASSNLFQKKG